MLLLLSDKHVLNNNALSSVSLACLEPMRLEDKLVVKGGGAVMLLFRFEYKTSAHTVGGSS